MKLMFGAVVVLLLGLVALLVLRVVDHRADRAEWRRLTALQPPTPERFASEMVADLPEPARRFFSFTIKPGTPLWPVAEIDMGGTFSLGTREEPAYQSMEARQILAAPHGFVWSMRTRAGWMPVSGSDTARWTRFRILGFIPVARLGGDTDHTRSAFGRYVAEAAFWTPAALMPRPGLTWEALGPDTARYTVRYLNLEQSVDIRVDPEGRPVQVTFLRWSNANTAKVHRLQPFGGHLSDFREVGGYRLPFRVEAGNMFGTEAYFPFFLATVTAVRFPGPAAP